MIKPAFAVAWLLAIVATVAPAWYHGNMTFRWGDDRQTVELAKRLAELPENFGDWQLAGQLELSNEEMNQLRPAGYFARRYVKGDLTASVFVLIGPMGPTAAHTPDICFSSRDFRIIGERTKVKLKSPPNDGSEFWLTRFESRRLEGHALRTWYAWTVDGKWSAPESARFAFGSSRFLAKIQVAVSYPDRESMDIDEAGEDLLSSVRRSLTDRLFSQKMLN
jgi:Protein of unknown function (DUF3485)